MGVQWVVWEEEVRFPAAASSERNNNDGGNHRKKDGVEEDRFELVKGLTGYKVYSSTRKQTRSFCESHWMRFVPLIPPK